VTVGLVVILARTGSFRALPLATRVTPATVAVVRDVPPRTVGRVVGETTLVGLRAYYFAELATAGLAVYRDPLPVLQSLIVIQTLLRTPHIRAVPLPRTEAGTGVAVNSVGLSGPVALSVRVVTTLVRGAVNISIAAGALIAVVVEPLSVTVGLVVGLAPLQARVCGATELSVTAALARVAVVLVVVAGAVHFVVMVTALVRRAGNSSVRAIAVPALVLEPVSVRVRLVVKGAVRVAVRAKHGCQQDNTQHSGAVLN